VASSGDEPKSTSLLELLLYVLGAMAVIAAAAWLVVRLLR
jgi:flagellar biogenesis protein FliO